LLAERAHRGFIRADDAFAGIYDGVDAGLRFLLFRQFVRGSAKLCGQLFVGVLKIDVQGLSPAY
jgi:hypothetical protein